MDVYRGITLDPVVFNVKDGSGNPINLSGWTPYSTMRNGYGKPIDLQPSITNAATGEVTISLTKETTDTFTVGEQYWDLLFQKPSGQRIGPYITGIITVKDTVTQL